ncbi:MAG: hypothetical protein IPJ30_12465 [Acidobacteria bacterium]|nr:hypothetical protein [Acidobacteriota bacterium]
MSEEIAVSHLSNAGSLNNARLASNRSLDRTIPAVSNAPTEFWAAVGMALTMMLIISADDIQIRTILMSSAISREKEGRRVSGRWGFVVENTESDGAGAGFSA